MKKTCFKKILVALCAIYIINVPNTIAAEKLRFIGDQNISTGEKFKDTEIGGLSGLAFDKEKNRILAISDDRSAYNDARFYEFDLKLDEKNFKVTPVDVITLKNSDGKSFKKNMVDFEGITFFNNDLLISSEGWINHEPPFPPQIIQFSRTGAFKNFVEVPEKFIPLKNQENKIGVRDNQAFEGLSAAPDFKSVWVGTEEALNQDDRTTSSKYSSIVRMIQYKDMKPVREFAYQLEKVPSIKVAGLIVGETGLSEILAIDENSFYSVERSFMPLARKVVVRIFKTTVDSKTTDISKLDSIKGLKTITTVNKELVADLEDFTAQMGAGFQKIDNIEGICFGPKLASGNNSLILVSDNNFSRLQRTQFLAFEIIP